MCAFFAIILNVSLLILILINTDCLFTNRNVFPNQKKEYRTYSVRFASPLVPP